MALANIHNTSRICGRVPSQVLNLTWFQKGAEVTQRPVLGELIAAKRLNEDMFSGPEQSGQWAAHLPRPHNPTRCRGPREQVPGLLSPEFRRCQQFTHCSFTEEDQVIKDGGRCYSSNQYSVWEKHKETPELRHGHSEGFKCLTFEGEEDPWGGEGLDGGGQPPGRRGQEGQQPEELVPQHGPSVC